MQRLRFLEFFQGAQSPGQILHRKSNPMIVVAKQFAPDRQNLARCLFGFSPAFSVSLDQAEVAERIGGLQMLVSE